MSFIHKNKELEEIKPEETIDNKLEFLKFMSQVQSSIKDCITEDFIFAKLGDKQKEAIIEMVCNAYYGKKLLSIVAHKSKKRWVWKKDRWEHIERDSSHFTIMNEYSKNVFDAFMTRIYMMVILNRNVKENPLLRLLAGMPEDESESEGGNPDASEIVSKLKNLVVTNNDNKQP